MSVHDGFLAKRVIELEAALAREREEVNRLDRMSADYSAQLVAAEAALAAITDTHVHEWVRRARESEAALADMRTTVARQLTPLDVAITHVQIVRNKQGEYTDEERDNVLSITESHAKEVRDALFAALATADSGPKEGTKWGPDHPSYDEMGQ